MRKLLLLFIPLLAISCNSPENEDVFQGKLEEFLGQELSFERDTVTGFMNFYSTVEYQGKEALYTFANGQFQFFDTKTGRKTGSFQIPKEGPLALKGGVFDGAALSNEKIIAYNEFGHVNLYEQEAVQKSFQLPMDKIGLEKSIYFRNQRMDLIQISNNSFEILNDPFDMLSNMKDNPGFDLNFGAWVAQFDGDGNWLCISDFRAPYDESFQNTFSIGALTRMKDSESHSTWIQFPFSDSLYQVKECLIVNRLRLESKTNLNFKPEERTEDGGITTWKRPDDGSINQHLVRDSQTGLAIRVVLLKEKDGNPDETDQRKKIYSKEATYLFLIYDPDWNLLAELEMVYPIRSRFENLISTKEGLFINKPEQASEDEYEFYKIDLSRFAD